MTAVILGIVMAGLWIIGRWDKPLVLSERGYLGIGVGAFVEESVILWLTGEESIGISLLLAVAGGCLLLACVTDLMIYQVYNFTWWPALVAAAFLLWSVLCAPEAIVGEILNPLLAYLALQCMVFCRVYGRADCYAFCICAVVETSRGFGLVGYLLHMLAAYALLLLVQAFRRNINKKGNLKQPVPFLPYITASFWIVIGLGRYV